MNHFRHVWDKARCSLGQRKTGEEVRSGSLNRVTRPAGDNDIYARQVYDVWSATHELRVGHRRRRRSKSAESSNVCARECPERSVSSRVRDISWKCDFQSFAHISNVAATDLRTDDIHIWRFMQNTLLFMYDRLIHICIWSLAKTVCRFDYWKIDD